MSGQTTCVPDSCPHRVRFGDCGYRGAAAALVLQGGGALGAFEFGAARALFEQRITPDVIAGVSIGAITAVLLARPVERLGPLGALLASGSLPPAFPMTDIGDQSYWDGGLFDNTPLGAVLDRLDPAADVQRTVYVVNLFPNKGPIPDSMPAVAERMKNLQFANKTLGDLSLLCRFNEVAELMQVLQNLPEDHPRKATRSLQDREKTRLYAYLAYVAITPPEPSPEFGDADFSPEAIDKREKQVHAEALKALSAPPQDPCSALNDGAG